MFHGAKEIRCQATARLPAIVGTDQHLAALMIGRTGRAMMEWNENPSSLVTLTRSRPNQLPAPILTTSRFPLRHWPM